MTSSSPGRQPGEPTEPTYADRVFRSPGALAGGVLVLLLAAWVGGDALIRGEGRTPWVALAGLFFAVPLVVAYTLRPAVFANDDRLRIRNPFRTITLPWAAVDGVRAGYSSEVLAGGKKYQLWAVPVSLRQRKRVARQQAKQAHDDPYGRTSVTADVTDAQARRAPADQTVEDLREQAERCAARPTAQGDPEVRWAYEIIAPCVVGAVALTVLLAAG
ncbi:PH domain-containing protein [Streptomyces sp. ISL-98]|uniref:PH domain-containing protein n=1 Tax=Streptomyces sp. ISL-98 TaxID=2819192 RepID=UPI001BEA07F2|nr:PH domain-containing protein [Streptomyces sp. ISL-98]MBT2507303.1 PH domain-containing protein [Streptomyces sp. ISL-98]